VADIVVCCSLERASAAVDAALTAVSQMATSAELQTTLLDSGALPHIIPLLFGYDATHQEDAPQQDSGDNVTRGPSFLGLGVERATVQVSHTRDCVKCASHVHVSLSPLLRCVSQFLYFSVYVCAKSV
jgi:hypothetical protein